MKEYICGDGIPVIENYVYGNIVRNHKEPFAIRKGVFSLREEPPFIELYAARTLNGELCLQPLMQDYPDFYEQYPPKPVREIDLSKFFAIDLKAFKKKLKRGSMRYKDQNGMPILEGVDLCDRGGSNRVGKRNGKLGLLQESIVWNEEWFMPLDELNLKELTVHNIPLKLYVEGNKNG